MPRHIFTVLRKNSSHDNVLDMVTKHIRELAERRGIKNANTLQQAAGLSSPTVAAKLWKGDFEMIGLATLDKLCAALRCKVGDLLVYHSDMGKKSRK
jgi:DNA-binding Xre family transcriptional regulator